MMGPTDGFRSQMLYQPKLHYPVAGLLGRMALGGNIWEDFTEAPYPAQIRKLAKYLTEEA